jgi:peptidoglycan/LPS O-acetylase OafA/YrhL
MKAELRSLTGLRGLAACWVMCGHFLNDVTLPFVLRRTIDHGYLAVDMFMVLSGFVLAMIYGARFAAAPTWRLFGRFLWMRLARIYPLYALTTFVCLVLSLSGVPVWGEPQHDPLAVVANLLLVQGWGWPNESLNAAAWSISTEWAANLLFPVLATTLLGWCWRRGAMVAAGAFAILTVSALLAGQSGLDEPIIGAINWYLAPGALLRCISEFMLGMACWRARDLAGGLGGTAVQIGLALTILILCQSYAADLILVLAICLLVIGLSFERSALSRALGSTPLRWLGTISFSIYLWQMPLAPIVPKIASWAAWAGLASPPLVANLALMALVLLVAHVSFVGFERPAQRWLRGAMARPWRIGSEDGSIPATPPATAHRPARNCDQMSPPDHSAAVTPRT